jgi:hypothetical protein
MTSSKTTSTRGRKAETKAEDPTTAAPDSEVTALALQKGAAAKSLSVAYPPSNLPQGRPVSPSEHQVADTFSAVGAERPIFSSTLQVSGIIKSSGERPISASTLVISETYSLMGNRPIASNEIDDPNTLMGYLD